MSAHVKNRILAYIVLAMLLTVFLIGRGVSNTAPEKASILIPKAKPVHVVVSEEPTIDEVEFECLRLNLFHEARNQSRKGMEAVALVTLNRTKTKHYPSTICGVVKQAVVRNGVVVRHKCQFSWFCDGANDTPDLSNPIERRAWATATEVAKNAMQGRIKDFTGGATHYHATYVSPFWRNAKRFKRVAQVGTHIFYRDVKLRLKA